jgi:hypothetical protein
MAAPTSVNKRLGFTNFRKSKFCSRLTDERLYATLRVSSSSSKEDIHKFVTDTQPQKFLH